MLRKILGVIAGYLIFAVSAVMLFQFTGHKAHEPASTGFMVLAAVYGTAFSFLAGFILQVIARAPNLGVNYVLALIMAAFAAFSLSQSTGSHWTQLLAIFIFAPSSILGGFYYMRQKRNFRT